MLRNKHSFIHSAAHVGHLVLEEGEAVLTMPVVGLVLHPVEPGRVQMIFVMTVRVSVFIVHIVRLGYNV